MRRVQHYLTERFLTEPGWRLAAVLAVGLLLGGAGDQAARYDKIGHELMCACGCRQILLECNHVGCSYSSRMNQELSEALTRGDSDDLVRQAFVQKYGNTVLAAPTTKGFNRVAWIMPFFALLAGLSLAVMVIRSWSGRLQPVPSEAQAARLSQMRDRVRRETEI
jgi:cytochrome c-type biogenesis protein CcmH/NrfF